VSHTSKKIQQVKEIEPRRPEAASRGVIGTEFPAGISPWARKTDIAILPAIAEKKPAKGQSLTQIKLGKL
jgi:hypothetical protein